MDVLNRNLTTREKMLVLLLSFILLALVYYKFVDEPVRRDIAAARNRQLELQDEIDLANLQLMQIRRMQEELAASNSEMGGSLAARMPSYSSKKEEYDFLNSLLLEADDYYIGFSGISRDGEQVRRNFSLRFDAGSFESAENILRKLENSEIRCLIGDVNISTAREPSRNDAANYYQERDILTNPVTVNAVATFYETTYEGTADMELPAEN